ncbi:MAG TPA: hypothetical protein VFZ21_10365 [Gemmatimonadaceae bacterium]|nr:hypothetical protein [Gemmatimonadaceae bacterium]
MSAVGGRVLALLLIAQACTPNPQELARAALASDSLTFAFADAAAQRALAAEPSAPAVAEHPPHACDEPAASVELTAVQSGAVSLTLPADFTPIDTARVASHGIHRWLGADKSTIVVRPDAATYHSGWTGSLTSECTVDIAGARAHIDLADATVEVPDYVVRAVLERPRMLPFVFEGHGRSVRHQAELLRALRSLSIAEGAWIRSVVLQ